MTNTDHAAIDLLLQRLQWPSCNVREKACRALSRLIMNVESGPDVQNLLLAWIGRQRLESVAALGLLVFCRVKLECGTVVDPRNLLPAISCPSLLSWMILRNLYGDAAARPVPYDLHSGTSPKDFIADGFFLAHSCRFLPPVYRDCAEFLETRLRIPFLRQWGFEWTRLRELVQLEMHVPSVGFWTRQDYDHLLGMDLPMSEVYRSAYLRALGWAVHKGFVTLEDAAVFAAQTCPIDVGLWRIEPGTRPDGWQTAEGDAGTIETVLSEVHSVLATLWEKQSTEDWVIGAASGRVTETENSAYDIDIRGVVQSCAGATVPELADAVDWGNEPRIRPAVSDHLAFEGVYSAEEPQAHEGRVGDWRIWQVAAPVQLYAVPRWQSWRLYRDIWLPTPFLSVDDLSIRCTGDAVVVESGGQHIGRWTDWAYKLGEMATANLSPSSGQALLLRRQVAEDAASRVGGRYAWICRITSYHRKHHMGEFEIKHSYTDYGTTRLVR
jgi:hypothetical protein